MINGVGPEMETVTNSEGGKQAKVLYRFDLIDSTAIFALTKVLSEGADKYGDNNWRKIDSRTHINHALIHLYAYLAGDTQDEHLSHALARIMMSIGTEVKENVQQE